MDLLCYWVLWWLDIITRSDTVVIIVRKWKHAYRGSHTISMFYAWIKYFLSYACIWCVVYMMVSLSDSITILCILQVHLIEYDEELAGIDSKTVYQHLCGEIWYVCVLYVNVYVLCVVLRLCVMCCACVCMWVWLKLQASQLLSYWHEHLGYMLQSWYV